MKSGKGMSKMTDKGKKSQGSESKVEICKESHHASHSLQQSATNNKKKDRKVT